MVMQVFVVAPIAYHMDGIAGLTFLKMMIMHELLPVRPLIRHNEAGSPAERAYIIERCYYRCPYKFRSVGDAFHCVSQRFRDFERDDIELFPFHVDTLPTRRFDKHCYFVTPTCQGSCDWACGLRQKTRLKFNRRPQSPTDGRTRDRALCHVHALRDYDDRVNRVHPRGTGDHLREQD